MLTKRSLYRMIVLAVLGGLTFNQVALTALAQTPKPKPKPRGGWLGVLLQAWEIGDTLWGLYEKGDKLYVWINKDDKVKKTKEELEKLKSQTQSPILREYLDQLQKAATNNDPSEIMLINARFADKLTKQQQDEFRQNQEYSKSVIDFLIEEIIKRDKIIDEKANRKGNFVRRRILLKDTAGRPVEVEVDVEVQTTSAIVPGPPTAPVASANAPEEIQANSIVSDPFDISAARNKLKEARDLLVSLRNSLPEDSPSATQLPTPQAPSKSLPGPT